MADDIANSIVTIFSFLCNVLLKIVFLFVNFLLAIALSVPSANYDFWYLVSSNFSFTFDEIEMIIRISNKE